MGALAIVPITKEKVRRMAIKFVDDTNFYSNGLNYQQKINSIIKQYTKLYQATRDLVEIYKSFYYAWKWKYSNGQASIKNIIINIEIDRKTIKQIPVSEIIRTLGVLMNLSLT